MSRECEIISRVYSIEAAGFPLERGFLQTEKVTEVELNREQDCGPWFIKKIIK